VLNYEEGAERSVLHGDPTSEWALSDVVGARPLAGRRNPKVESAYEYGSRVGVWRLLRLFADRRIPITVFATGMALERHPAVAAALMAAGHEVACHGWRWIDYDEVDEETERAHLRQAVEGIQRLTGARPLGWYLGRTSARTRRLVVEEGGFLYDSDAYNDELPYWVAPEGRPHLVVPYSLGPNDSKFGRGGFFTADDYFTFFRDGFDVLYREGRTQPKMMSVGLHNRLIGHPSRTAGLERALDYVMKHAGVWVTRSIDIARHWIAVHPHPSRG
jgi:putative urate catabolism protein